MLSLQTSLLTPPPALAAPCAGDGRIRRARLPGPAQRRQVARSRTVQAVIGEERSVSGAMPMPVIRPGSPPDAAGAGIEVRVVVTVQKKLKEKLTEKVEEHWESLLNGVGKGIVVQLISEEIDPATEKVKKSAEAAVRGWLPKPSSRPHVHEYAAEFTVPAGFGRPGAVLITNLHSKEFHLMEIVVHGFSEGPVFFPANSWVHSCNDSTERRIIFRNQALLPSQTPEGLKDLRRIELDTVRGNGKGMRQNFDRVYDYDVYNDLGNPDKDEDLARPILGGRQRPYPRRCRTGRPPCKSDPSTESRIEKPHSFYVPRDETFEEVKQATFAAGAFKALLHNLIPSLVAAMSNSDNHFECFSEIDMLYKEGVSLGHEENHPAGAGNSGLAGTLKRLLNMKERLMKYDIPSIISRDRFSWLRDVEFARQTLAGMNPCSIERLKEFPIMSKLDPALYGPPESAITREIIETELNGMTVEEAMEKGKLFVLDYHDMLLPFVKKINSLKDRKAYASRTVFFYTDAGILRPIAIELTLPPKASTPQKKKLYAHGHDATTTWTWKLAKAHVCSNDAGVHQLVNHWLRTHACMEAYTIAAHRQLSSMHPVFKLLHPHMRYTLEINALARQSLINGGGIIEACFSPGKYSMEVSAAAYKSWRFDMEGLPADLIRRGMAVEDPTSPCGLKLVIEDYPYAADGLLIWSAIKQWVHDYIFHFYTEDSSAVSSDAELQGWWDEVRNKGHADKRDETWWPTLRTREDLEGVLTTIIWTASGQHAAINFGQYPFGGYMPNRPALMKRLIPEEECDGDDYRHFLTHPEHLFLMSLPTQLQATKVMAVQDTLSTHAPDEEYLGQMHESHNRWIDDQEVLGAYERFSAKLQDAEEEIAERNRNKRLMNRSGAGIPPYELLLPTSGPGVTGRGIPNSVSI